MADGDDFYVEDEPIEQVRANWKKGEKGETVGKRDLDQRAKSVVDQAVARLESAETDARIRLTVVSSGTVVGEAVEYADPDINRSDDSNVTELFERLVG